MINSKHNVTLKENLRKNSLNNPSLINHLFLFVIVFTFGCSKSPKCWGDDKDKGIIEKSISITREPRCLPKFHQDNYVITNDSAYIETFPTDCDLESIDFNKYSLLGQFASGGCKVKFIREVIQNKNYYHYKLTVKNCGTCKSLAFSYNWVLVPKIPKGWNITFELLEN